MVSYSDDIKQIFAMFMKPFMRHVKLPEDQSQFQSLIDIFFGPNFRHVHFCRSLERFVMPGLITSPTSRVKRNVKVNDTILIRYDVRTPDNNDVEFNGQEFKLTEMQRNHVLEKLKIIC